ncbi:acylneuraminate cytidylyltransferase family protein [Halodesulfovibrio sp.]|uniref:acylneuraminate cytidylyltransferase family protein n=1 Tax=Halodesulfovibrio sp. TaxID=1912772 RepID=UPI0025E577DC|nr:acylneuraminate cytidylyltransferase family protein [Halodesulfovibrio sp.]MCT4626533.1 acylneuraminate cytidylyltransferase family protein [Halodesulfovibrio sp.]
MAEVILCTICARGGSKGVPNKNIRLLAGKPLLAHTVEQAIETDLFEEIAFSSDSSTYLEAAKEAGASVLIKRPAELATDSSGKLAAIRHCVEKVEEQLNKRVDIVVDLDCTSPLRLSSDIAASINLLRERGIGNVITGAPARRSPYFNLVERTEAGGIDLAKKSDTPFLRRQDTPECYDMNASIYVWRRDVLMEKDGLFHEDTDIYVMPEERSIDIDCEMDFDIVSMLLERRSADN